MSVDRRALLEGFVKERPEDPFPRYALALEHRRLEQTQLAAQQLQTLRERFPDYLPGYLILGQLLETLQRTEEAAEVLTQGLGLARRCADAHTEAELQAALTGLAALGPRP